MAKSESIHVLGKEVYVKENKDGCVVYADKRTFVLNEVGALMLKGTLDGLSREEIASKIEKEYEVDRETVMENLSVFIRRLLDEKLLLEKNGSGK